MSCHFKLLVQNMQSLLFISGGKVEDEQTVLAVSYTLHILD